MRFVEAKRRTATSNPVNYNGFCTSEWVLPPPAQDAPEAPSETPPETTRVPNIVSTNRGWQGRWIQGARSPLRLQEPWPMVKWYTYAMHICLYMTQPPHNQTPNNPATRHLGPQKKNYVWGLALGSYKISLILRTGLPAHGCLCFTVLSAPWVRFVEAKRPTATSNPVNYKGFCTTTIVSTIVPQTLLAIWGPGGEK